MAFASVGTLGSVQSKTANQATLVLTTTATLEANNLGVIVIAVDNNSATDGDEGAVTGVVDSAGNTWTKGAEFTNGQTVAQAGATCSIWYKQVATQLTSGGTITASFSNSASRDAAAATAWEFTVGAGNTVAVEATNTLAVDAGTPGSLDATTTNIACLRIRGIADESPLLNSTLTVTATWTKFTDQGTSGGAGPTNMSAVAEFLISTGTGAASSPSNASGTPDSASVYVALKEVGAAAASPFVPETALQAAPRRPISLQSQVYQINPGLLATLTAAESPFAPDLWPTPLRRPWTPQTPVQQPNIALQSSLVVAATPFFSAPLSPPPRAAPFQFDWIHTNHALGVITVDVLPPRQNYWPLPRAPEYPASLRGYTNYNYPLYSVDVVAAPFRPLPTQLPRVVYTPQPPVEQRSITLLGTPFGQSSWPPPRTVAFTPTQFPVQPNIALRAEVVVSTPFAQTSWPLPPPAIPFVMEWIHTNMALGAPEVVVTLPFAQFDWPVPRRPYHPVPRFPSQISAALAATLVLERPFAQTYWPLPPVPRSQLQALVQQRSPALLGTPFAQLLWPPPQRPLRPPTQFPPQLSAALGASLTVPFAQTYWPAPQRPLPVPPRTETQLSPALVGTLVFETPFAQTYWPPPIRRVEPNLSWIHTNLPLGQVAVEAGQPFAQTSWPLPRITLRPPLRFESQVSAALAATLVVSKPFSQTYWAAPIRGVPGVPPRVFQRNSQLYALDQLPFRQSSWPPPIQPRVGLQQVIQRNLGRYLLDQLPFRQSEWPLPRVPRQPNSVYTWVQRPLPPLLAFVPPNPFAQYSWPLPRAPLYPYSLLGYEYKIYPIPGKFAGPPIPPIPASEIPSGYESQVGVWHGGNVRHGRTGKRYRIYR